jgi:hypothetical protein
MPTDLGSGRTHPLVFPGVNGRNGDQKKVRQLLSGHDLLVVAEHEASVSVPLPLGKSCHKIQRVPRDNDPVTRDLVGRMMMGQEPWRLVRGRRGWNAEYMGRLKRHPDWGMKAVFDISVPGGPLVTLHLYPVSPSPPPEGLTAEVIRGIRFEDVRAEARAWLQILPTLMPGLDASEFDDMKRPGRRGQKDLFYARWALRYVGELRNTPNPLPKLASEPPFRTASAIRGFLHEARRRGLLTAAPPGRAGGDLTDKAKALLRRNKGMD